MFRIILFYFFVLLLGFGPEAFPEATGEINQFQAGVHAYESKDYASAVELFTKALSQSPRQAALLTNLGLSHFKLGNKGYAMAYLRQALSLDPGLSTSTAALEFVRSQLAVKEIPHRIETFETLREKVLEPVDVMIYGVSAALFLLGGGWIFLSYLGRRRQAEKDENAAPVVPVLGIFLLVLALISGSLGALKGWDLTQIRGTVVESKVSAVSAPGENQAVLFELYEGLELIIRRKQEGWVQVTYPGGMTGWIPEKAILPSKI